MRAVASLFYLASVEAQLQVEPPMQAPVWRSANEAPVIRRHGTEQDQGCGYERSAQLDDARLLLSFVLGFFFMHWARSMYWGSKREVDPDGFGNFDFLEEPPVCQIEVLKLTAMGGL